MAAPAVLRRQGRIVVREVVVRLLDRRAGLHVAEILVGKRRRIVFHMVEHVEPVAGLLMHEADPHLGRIHQDFEARHLFEIGAAHLGPARHRDREIVGESPEIRRGRREVAVPVHAERLFGQLVFRHAVEMMDRGLCAPADVEAAMHVGLRPVEDAAQLVPVGHLLEGKRLHRRAGDDEAVEALGTNVLPLAVEGNDVLARRIAGDVIRDLDERQLHLERRGAEQPRELRLGPDLVRHEVQQADPHRPDVLAHGVGLAHDHHAFRIERGAGRQIVRYLYRHRRVSFGGATGGVTAKPSIRRRSESTRR